MDTDAGTVTLVAELGFIAGEHGAISDVEKIADALASMRPGTEQPYLIRAYGRLGSGDALGAEKILREEVLSANPDSTEGKTMLGLALHLAGKSSERDKVFDELTSAVDDGPVAEIAEKLRGLPISK